MVVNKLSLPQTSHIYTYGVVCLWMRKNVLRRNGAAPDCPAPKRSRQTVLLRALLHVSARDLPPSLSSCAAGRRTLRSSVHGDLAVPFATMQSRSFSVVGPTTWNELPSDLRHLPNGACAQFHQRLKTVLFRLA